MTLHVIILSQLHDNYATETNTQFDPKPLPLKALVNVHGDAHELYMVVSGSLHVPVCAAVARREKRNNSLVRQRLRQEVLKWARQAQTDGRAATSLVIGPGERERGGFNHLQIDYRMFEGV
jgi:hypothetical protein